jgi:hypothetical protein
MYIHENIIYERLESIPVEQLQSVEKTLPKQSELRVYKTDEQIRSENIYANRLSSRNTIGNYIVPTENESVLINFIPSKLVVPDSSINYFMDSTFQYFPDPVFADELPEPISFAEGTIFRVTGEGVRSKEEYTYYSIENGIVSKIPNYKTVEVLLFERGRGLDDIQIIEPTEFDDLLHNSLINKYVQEGLTYEEATEQAAKFILTTPRQNNMTSDDLG